MSQWFGDARNIYDAVDADLIRSYQAGLILGILLITTLALFPGKLFNLRHDSVAHLHIS